MASRLTTGAYGPPRTCSSSAVKRLISVVVGLVLGVTLWAGPAGADSELMESSAVQNTAQDPIARVFSDVRSTLSQAGSSNPLRALLNTIAAQLDSLEADLAQLYDDLFVGTCPTCEREPG